MNPAPKSATYDASTENPRRDCVARTLTKNTKVKVITDSCGDLPISLIGRYGKIVGRSKHNDEPGHYAYSIAVNGWAKPKVLFDDEIVVV